MKLERVGFRFQNVYYMQMQIKKLQYQMGKRAFLFPRNNISNNTATRGFEITRHYKINKKRYNQLIFL